MYDTDKNKYNPSAVNIFLMNFCSSFNPVYFCTIVALLLYRNAPIFKQHALNVLLISGCYTLPWLCSSAASYGFLARFSSRNVMFYSRMIEIIIAMAAAVFIGFINATGYIPLFVIAVLMGLNLSIYRPALKVYTSKTVKRKQLARICSVTECAALTGITLGAIGGIAAVQCHLPNSLALGLAMIPAAVALIFASKLESVPAPKADKEDLKLELKIKLPKGLVKLQRYRELVMTGVGECYVFTALILISSIAVQYLGLHFTDVTDNIYLQYLLMATPILGCIFGIISSGYRSKGNVEIGIVPTGILFMIFSSLAVGLLPFAGAGYTQGSLLVILLFIFGFATGSILVPLQCYQAYFIKREFAPKFFSWFYLPFSGGLLLAIILAFLMYFFNVSIFTVCLVVSLLTLTLSIVSFILMPQFLLRMLFRIMLDTIYRLNIYNQERLPENGPALLVANRASFVDILFISACTSRPIRFMMHEHYYRVPILHTLYKSIGFLEVPSKRVQKHKELIQTTRDLLKSGELICVFPEDDITRNGTMSSFRNGIGNWLPEDMDIPVIPMRIGMTWGSIFSCSQDGRFKFRLPGFRRHPASVTIGNPISRDTNAYEMRIIMAELGADTELIPDPSAKPLHTLFCYQAKRNPRGRIFSECTAPKWKKPNNFSTFIKAVLLSRFLRRTTPTDEGGYIGIMLPNSIDFAIAMLGTQMANKAPAILNYTAGSKANGIAIEKSGLRRIITTKETFEKSGIQTDAKIIYIDEAKKHCCTWWSKLCWHIAAWLFPANELMKQISPENWNDVNQVGVLIFSSGSTGIPKGIMLTHHNIIADVLSISSSINYRKNDGIVGNLPLFHSFGMAVCFWMPIVTGTRTVLIPNPLDAASVAESMKYGSLTVLSATPGFLQLYMRRCVPEDFKNIRLVISGAEKLRDDVAEKFRNMTGLVITEAYGCTELSPVVSINLAASVNEMGTHVVEPGSIGPPLIGVCAKVVDPSTFELMDENTDGLLIVKGAIVMKGYLGEPEKTKEVIRDGWYITGDIARMSRRGFIAITGRLSRFSKIAGEMVPHELVEREMNNILSPEDRLLAVCGASDAAKGEKLIVFYCDRERLAPEQLIKRLREKGIPNLWIPKQENFIFLDNLPVLGNGKLDLAALKKEAEKYNS